MLTIYFYEVFEEEAIALQQFLPSHFSYEMTSATIQEAGHTEPPAAVVSIRTQSRIPESWASKLDGILSRSTGYDHLVEYLRRTSASLPCGYLEEYATHAVAEHAVLLSMALLRKLPQQWRQFPTFDRDGITGNECRGKRLLVVGVGRIGSEIVRLGLALGMDVRGVDVQHKHSFVSYTSKEEGLRWADIVVCAMNLTADNRSYFNYETLKQTRAGTFFINIARGEHAPLEDLLRLIEEKHLGGIGLDVFEDEPLLAPALRSNTNDEVEIVKNLRKLLQYPHVLLTPHNAFNTKEAVERKARYTVEQLQYFAEHRQFLWQVRL